MKDNKTSNQQERSIKMSKTTNFIVISAVIFVVLLIVFGSSLFTHAEAGIKTVRKSVQEKIPDEMLVEECKVQLLKAKQEMASHRAEVMRFKRELEQEEAKAEKLQQSIFSHQTALEESDMLLSTEDRYFLIGGGKVSRSELEADVFARIEVLEGLRNDYKLRVSGLQGMRDAFGNVNKQLNIAEQNVRTKEQQLQKLEMDLKANRIKSNFQESVSTMISSLENSSLNASFERLEARNYELQSLAEPYASGLPLLDFTSNALSAREAIRRALAPEITEPGDPRTKAQTTSLLPVETN